MDIEALIEHVLSVLPDAAVRRRDGEVCIDFGRATARILNGRIMYVREADGADDEIALRNAISGQ